MLCWLPFITMGFTVVNLHLRDLALCIQQVSCSIRLQLLLTNGYAIEASRGFLQLSVPMTLIRPKGVAKEKMKRAMRIIV